jgi:multisubunit Na+/H+ antiporter MnhF subunit
MAYNYNTIWLTLQYTHVFTSPTLTSRLAALLACKLTLVLFLMLLVCLPHILTLNLCRLLSMAHLPALAGTVK